MRILGVETSCDETSAAIIEDGTKILSNIVASSAKMHAKYGGIIPEVAAREQVKSIIPVIEESISNFHLAISNIDAIAVTIGPGLIGSLLVGIEAARTLSYVWNKPIIPINHLVAHIYANFLENNTPPSINHQPITQHPPQFPAIALVVSGGHTDLVFMKGHGQIEWLGGTRDDAAGECLDKTARLLGFGYPGGPAIAAAAAQFQNLKLKSQIKLPRPMINEENFDFSFSGLKTAILREVNKLKVNQQFNSLAIQQLSYEVQEAVTGVLISKTIRAAQKFKAESILLAGGVSANQRLREKMQFQISNLKSQIEIRVPPPKLCTDNAAYIASCAFFNYKPFPWQELSPIPGLAISQEV